MWFLRVCHQVPHELYICGLSIDNFRYLVSLEATLNRIDGFSSRSKPYINQEILLLKTLLKTVQIAHQVSCNGNKKSLRVTTTRQRTF